MSFSKTVKSFFLVLMLFVTSHIYAAGSSNIPILCYHNLNPTVPGSMTMKPSRFEEQIKWLTTNGYTIVPLHEVVAYLEGKRVALPEKSVVITFDDGWESAYKYLFPIVKKYNFPVTLFIYPETISHGKNAMTWEQLKTLQATGLFDIQSHTYSHPNFKHAKRGMSAAAYEKYVRNELVNSKKILEEKLSKKISYLAWPFGIYDRYLEQAAANAGYTMAFTIDAVKSNKSYRAMAQPRYMIVEPISAHSFVMKVGGQNIKNLSRN